MAALEFPIGTILDILLYTSPRYFLPSFESVGLSNQEKKFKIDFQDGGRGGHFGIPIGTILAIFNLQVAPIRLSKYRVRWFRDVGEVVI